MVEVQIPFMERFREVMREGRKTSTCRTKRYGHPGDTFHVFDCEFQINSVSKIELHYVAELYRQEGLESPGEFMQVWSKLHRGIWNPNLLVWLHDFQRIQKRSGDSLPSTPEHP